MAKCPHCDTEIDSLDYSHRQETYGTFCCEEYNKKCFENLADPVFYCPECGEKITEGHINGIKFLGGKV